MKNLVIPMVFLAACGGGAAGAPPASVPRAALADTETETETATETEAGAGPVPFDVWYRVRATSGRGLAVGSGVRFRSEGFDVAGERLAQTMTGSCTSVAGGLDCDVAGGLLTARAASDGSVTVRQQPNELALVRAEAGEAGVFDATLAAHQAQTAACSAAARCCIDAENEAGLPCDLNARLGDRSTTRCQSALAAVRTDLATRASSVPASCR